uniref:NADH dehydrogenase subunit 6 n=1 Tax=Drechslerella dactyloides TaxID=74499 RepID=UPI0022FD65F9|nr:NADH dehydrogenase subunit 6 [Drechslerella dactyloides]WAN89835.1 NADH dehydrogenase subunit 6 [Drechslerella dactyloides]
MINLFTLYLPLNNLGFSTINLNNILYAIYSDVHTNGYYIIWLSIINIASVILGIFVIITRNPIIAVLYLIILFLAISCYLLLIGMSFIGLSYILVYISAISILFLFTLMLINIRISELHSHNFNSLILGLIISAIIYSSTTINLKIFNIKDSFWYENVFHTNYDIWDGTIGALNDITAIGNIMYTSHSMWLLITSIVLLLAMIGAILITIGHNNTLSEHISSMSKLNENNKW